MNDHALSESGHWQWKDDRPPGPQTVMAGDIWDFCLPLQGSGPPPRCIWGNPPWSPADELPGKDPLHIRVRIPDHLEGIHTLHYQMEGTPLRGTLRLKIRPAVTAASSPAPATPVAPDPEVSSPGPVSTDSAPYPTAAVGDPANRAAPAPVSHPAPTVTASPSPLPRQLRILVFRGSMLLPSLRQSLTQGHTLLIGKRSESRGIYPDLDLRGHFADEAGERSCSRQQARVFLSLDHGCVYLENCGRGPMTLDDGRLLAPGQTEPWPPGCFVDLPGGLRLLLEGG